MCFFVGFAYADLPIGTTFTALFPFHRPELARRTTAVIHSVTQQFGRPFDVIPAGWKTISLIDFPAGIPEDAMQLPVVDTWYTLREERLCLCGDETLDALLALASVNRVE